MVIRNRHLPRPATLVRPGDKRSDNHVNLLYTFDVDRIHMINRNQAVIPINHDPI